MDWFYVAHQVILFDAFHMIEMWILSPGRFPSHNDAIRYATELKQRDITALGIKILSEADVEKMKQQQCMKVMDA